MSTAINFHGATKASTWVPSHKSYGALEVEDASGSKITIFVDPDSKEFLQDVITSAAQLIALLEAPKE